jgi:DNA-binding Xre family transcriptional regulator
MTKLRRDEVIVLPILDRICETLGADHGDILEHVREEQVG